MLEFGPCGIGSFRNRKCVPILSRDSDPESGCIPDSELRINKILCVKKNNNTFRTDQILG